MTQATVLGISAFSHDSAAALVADGDIVAAAQEELHQEEARSRLPPSCAVFSALADGNR